MEYGYTTIGVTLANIVKERREEKGLSQRELAKRLNINNSVIARIENGYTKKPTFQIVKGLSEELNINLMLLLDVANYSIYEIEKMGYVEIKKYTGIAGGNRANEFYSYDSDDNKLIDIVKVLNGYKSGKISLKETFGLITMATSSDLTRYLPDNLREKYGLDDLIISK